MSDEQKKKLDNDINKMKFQLYINTQKDDDL